MKHGNALIKLCPMAARDGNNEDNRCVASGCMAWRWFNSDSGFCGLAGKPANSAGSGIIRKQDPPAAITATVIFFAEESCVFSSGSEISAKDLYAAYSGQNRTQISQKLFGSILATEFSLLKSIKRGGKIFYQGIRLK